MPDLTDEDDDLDQDTAISDPNAMQALLGNRAQTVQEHPPEPRPAAATVRPTPIPRQTQPGHPAQNLGAPRVTPVQGSAAQRPSQPPQRATPNPAAQPPQRNTPPPAEGRARPPAPRMLARTDIVPEFRRDLQIARVAGGVQVADPTTGEIHNLNEYEVSLARMLNGKRPVFEVLDSSERLGIPINVESLQKFIGKLEGMHLLQPAETLDAAVENAWPSRGQWESNVRTLFQTGIRFLRQGKHEEALGYFEALLAEDPDNEEAKELLEMSKQALRAPVPTVVVPGPPSAVGYALTPSGPVPAVNQHGQPYGGGTFTGTGGGTFTGGSVSQPYPHAIGTDQSSPLNTASQAYPQQYVVQPMPQHVPQYPQQYPQQPQHNPYGYAQPPGAPPMPAPMAAPSSPLSKKLLIPGLAALVLVGAGIGYVVLHKSKSAPQVAKVDPATGSGAGSSGSGAVKTESPKNGSAAGVGSGDAIKMGSGDPVKTGSATVPPDDGSGAGSAEPEKTGSGAGSAEPDKTGSGAGSGKTDPDNTKPEAAPAVDVSASMGGDLTSFLRAPRKVKKGEKLFSITKVSGDPAKIKELSAKVAEMQKLAKQDPVYEEFLANAKSDLAKARKVSTSVVTAPKAGTATPKVRNGATVRSGQVLAEIR